MFRLFKRDETGRIAAYHEVWVELKPRRIVEHWGMVGTRGDTDAHRIKLFRSLEKQVDDLLNPARDLGFTEIEPGDYHTLIVEYLFSDAWQRDDVLKIREAEEALTEVLGWTGLGFCDGETVTDTAIELSCRVLDPDLAQARIAEQMAGTEFADYSRMYQE
ncbi:MAG: hypothetical protein NXH78_10590 [Hyphomonadaceae bacterium]|nr:hypothetical protein [Hyphomonadaceae bacterium]